jgi:hypothetical protein
MKFKDSILTTIFLVHRTGSIKQSGVPPDPIIHADQKEVFLFFVWGVTFHKTFVNYTLLVLSLIGCFLPILVVFFHPDFIHSLLVSFPKFWLSANFGCFFFIHFHPLFTCSFPLLAFRQLWLFFFHPLSSTLWGLELLQVPLTLQPYVAICNRCRLSVRAHYVRAGSFLALL